MISVAELVELTGPLLTPMAHFRAHPVNDLVFADELASAGRDDVLLGAGIGSAGAALDLVNAAAERQASAVILRRPQAADPRVRSAVGTAGMSLLALDEATSWAHLVTLLQDVISRQAAGSPAVHADLFAMADAAAQILDAPVTIEDSHSRVLAYSLHHERTDPARVSTIIGRRVPERIVSHFRSRGVFRRMTRSDEPIYVPEGPDGTRPRLIVPIRAGGEWLGSIWAVVAGPASAEQIHDLAGATRALALQLLRLRTEANLDQRLSAEQVRAALTDPSATLPEGLMGFPCRVVAIRGILPGDPDPDQEVSVWTSTLQRNGWLQPIITHLGPAVFIISGGDQDTNTRPGSWPWLRQVIQTTSIGADGVRAGASLPADGPLDLPTARAQAEELLSMSPAAATPVTAYEEAWADLAVHRTLRALVTGSPIPSPLEKLIEADGARNSDLLTTLAAFLDHPGNPAAAARTLHIHPNTLRYRMRKVSGLVHLEEASPHQRLALHLLARAELARRQRPATSAVGH